VAVTQNPYQSNKSLIIPSGPLGHRTLVAAYNDALDKINRAGRSSIQYVLNYREDAEYGRLDLKGLKPVILSPDIPQSMTEDEEGKLFNRVFDEMVRAGVLPIVPPGYYWTFARHGRAFPMRLDPSSVSSSARLDAIGRIQLRKKNYLSRCVDSRGVYVRWVPQRYRSSQHPPTLQGCFASATANLLERLYQKNPVKHHWIELMEHRDLLVVFGTPRYRRKLLKMDRVQ